MDILGWISEIKRLEEELKQVQVLIKDEESLDAPNYENLTIWYAKEFEFAILLSGAFEDCMNMAEKYRNEGNEFMAKRIEKEALCYFPYTPTTIQVDG